ncbi:PAS domain-containing sensor histidine kinase, partial [Candidatus Entotheonella palauensis]|uniref:PAS domain-containing sensor histidine kinase n=1 Tax=Candidatus Entotheonella palauensis TaxID=93172 RepID=UPI0011777B07
MDDSANSQGQLVRELHLLRQQIAVLKSKEVELAGRGVLIHRDFKPLFVDQAWAAMHGYTTQEILHLSSISPLIVPDDRERIEHDTQLHLSGCEAQPYQTYQGVCKDGSRIWLESQLTVVHSMGEPAMQMTAVDLAKQHISAPMASESESYYQALVEQSLAGMYIIQDGRYRYVNPKFAEIVGYTQEEITTQFRHGQELVAESDRDLVLHNVQRRLQGETEPLHYTFKMVHKSGHDVDVEVHGTAMEFRGKRAVIGTLLDVTERKRAELALKTAHENLEESVRQRTAELWAANKHLHQEIVERERAEEALRKSEKRYRDLFENANDIVFTCDLSGQVTWMNRAAERLSGYTRDDMKQMSGLNVVAPEHRDFAFRMANDKRQRLAEITTYEVDIIAKGGERVSLEMCTQLIFENDEPVEVLGIGRNITERKGLEEQLRQTQKLEALGTLAGGIAHDFNNILSAILGFTELSLNEIEPEHDIRSHLQEVLAAGFRAKDLVRQILAFSRENSSGHRPILLTPLITETLKWLRGSLPSTITIRTHSTAPAGTVAANPTQLQQVLLNLCNNAEHSMRATGGVLDVQLESVHIRPEHLERFPDLQPGAHLRLIVRDTGSGMEPEIAARIFEPF